MGFAMSRLTPKQERFACEYVVDLSGTKAAIRAGYSPKRARFTGSDLLRIVAVKVKVAELQAEREKKGAISQAWVLERLRLVVERTLQEIPVTDAKGEPTGEWRFDAANATKALQLLGQHVGLFDERRDETTPPARALEHFRALVGVWNDSSRN
jgi:phage terminase small subunit